MLLEYQIILFLQTENIHPPWRYSYHTQSFNFVTALNYETVFELYALHTQLPNERKKDCTRVNKVLLQSDTYVTIKKVAVKTNFLVNCNIVILSKWGVKTKIEIQKSWKAPLQQYYGF